MPTKYERVASEIRETIQAGVYRVGDTLPTENALAERHDVSRMTVRKAVDELVAEGRLVRRQGSGTYVSAPPERNTYLYVGRTKGHFAGSVHTTLLDQCQQSGHSLSTYSTDNGDGSLSDTTHVEELIGDAAALICDAGSWSGVRDLVPGDVPVVLITGWGGMTSTQELSRPMHVISTNPRRAIEMATRHLMDLGHEEICYFGPGEMDDHGVYHEARMSDPTYQSYENALRSAGLEPAGAMGYPEGEGSDWQKTCEAAVRAFVADRDGWPTAFVCEGDFRAAPLLRVAMREGLQLPEELSVIGMCDTPWAEMVTPPLSSVSLREQEMARMAVATSELPRPDAPTMIRMEPGIVQRESTAPVARRASLQPA